MSQNSDPLMFTSADWRLLDSLEVRNLSQLKGITDDMAKAIIREVSEGVNAGEGISKLSSRISKATGVSKNRATVIARTETINSATDAALLRFEQYGVTEFRYIAASDTRVCARCAANNGKVFKTTDLEHRPPIHPQCRCAVAPVIPKREKGGATAGMSYRGSEARSRDDSPRSVMTENEQASIRKRIRDLTNSDTTEISDKVWGLDFRVTKSIFSNLNTWKRTEESKTGMSLLSRIGVMDNDKMYLGTRLRDDGSFEILLNKNKFSSGNIKQTREEYESSRSIYVPGESLELGGVHEGCHGINISYLHIIHKGDIQKISEDWNNSVNLSSEINMKSTAYKLISHAVSISKQSARDISEYAINTPADTIAEALMDVYLHGDSAKEISKILNELIYKELR